MTLIHSLKCVLSRMLPLRVFFRLDKMLFGKRTAENVADGGEENGTPQEEHNNGILRESASAFQDPMFWAYGRMLLHLEALLSDVEALAYSCPCHPLRLQQLREKRHRGKFGFPSGPKPNKVICQHSASTCKTLFSV